MGYLMIYPQDLSTNNSPLATALVNFLGAITPDQFNNADQLGDAAGTNYKRYVVTSVAGMFLRVELNFGTGTARFHLFGTYEWTTQPPAAGGDGQQQGTLQRDDIPTMGFERAFFVQNNP